MPRVPVSRTQQAHIRAARDELLDQLQVGRVVLHIEQRAPQRARAEPALAGMAAGSALSTASCGAAAEFSSNQNTLPMPTVLSTPISPPISSTSRLLITRPMPVPSSVLLSCPRRLKGWKSCISMSGGKPAPVSLTLMRTRSGVLPSQPLHDDRSVRLVVLDRVGKKVDENLLQPGPIGIHKARDIELRKGHFDAALLALRLDHGLAFHHHFAQRRRLRRQRKLSGLDLREIQDFVDQLQQIPSRVENLIDAGRLGGRWRRGIGIDELGEAQDRIERRAKLMAHAGKEIRFREVGFFRRGPGSLQLDVLFLQRLVEALGLGDVARGGEHALQLPVAVVEGGRVVGHHGCLAVPGASGELVVGELLLAQHQLDARLGPLRIGEIVLERRADQFVARAAGERLHLLVDVGDDAGADRWS